MQTKENIETLNTLQHFIQLHTTAHWMWSLLQVVGPRLWRKNTLSLKDKRIFRFATHKNTSFMQKRNMNAVDLSSSSVSSPTDGGDVELHVLGCATSTFTQLLNSGLYPWWWWWCRASCPRMSVDILGTNCDQCLSMVQCCFTSTENVRLIRTESTGRPLGLSHSSWTQRTANEL